MAFILFGDLLKILRSKLGWYDLGLFKSFLGFDIKNGDGYFHIEKEKKFGFCLSV